MREIKFKLVKDGVLQGIVELQPNGIMDVAYEWDTAYQYTGLKDKNGKEIYEGDYVIKNNRVCVVRWFGSPSFHGWDLKYVRNASNDNNPTKGGLWSGWEVIGNLYENPELKNG